MAGGSLLLPPTGRPASFISMEKIIVIQFPLLFFLLVSNKAIVGLLGASGPNLANQSASIVNRFRNLIDFEKKKWNYEKWITRSNELMAEMNANWMTLKQRPDQKCPERLTEMFARKNASTLSSK